MSDTPAIPAPRPLLLISGGPVTEPLWEPLAETYDLVFLYAHAAQAAMACGLPAAGIGSVMNADLQERVQNDAVLLAARVVNRLPELRQYFEQTLGPGSAPALGPALNTWFAGYAHTLMTQQVLLLALLDELEHTGRTIAGCVTHEDVAPDTRAMVAWCNQRGIPTLHVPHAPCHLLPGVQDIHRETRARYIAASGPAVAEFYAGGGHDPDCICLTGGPQWDGLYGLVPTRDESRVVLKIPDQVGPVICYMGTWGQTTSLRSGFEAEFDTGWQAVAAAAKQLGAYVIVMVHRSDQRQNAEALCQKALEDAGLEGLATRLHFLYALTAADLLVAQGPSNACIDAAILGVPSVYIQTEGFDFATALPRRAGAGDIAREISWALENPEPAEAWGEFISRYNAAHPVGDATAAVVAWVRELCAPVAEPALAPVPVAVPVAVAVPA